MAASNRTKKAFPLSLLKSKGQLYDTESLFRRTDSGKHVTRDAQTLSASFLGTSKTSFENAITLFLVGMGTEKGMLPHLEDQYFEP